METNSRLMRNILILWGHFTAKRKMQFKLILLLMILSSFAEMVSLGAVLPFLAIIASPDTVLQSPYILPLSKLFRIESLDDLRFVITFVFVIAAITAGSLRLLLLSLSTKVLFKAGIDLSVKIFQKTLNLPYSFHIQQNSSDIINVAFNKCNDVIYSVMLPIATLISSTILVVCIVSVLVSIEPLVMISSFAVFILTYRLILYFTASRVRLNSKIISRESTNSIRCLQEGLGGIRDVIISDAQDYFFANYKKTISKLRIAQGNNTIIGAAPRFMIETIGIVLIAFLALIMSSSEGGVLKAIPILGALAIGAQRLLPTLQQSYSAINSIRSVEFPLKDVLDMLSMPQILRNQRNDQPTVEFKGSICLKNLDYSYQSDTKKTLDNISLRINCGECVGIVGTTGGGKSTLLDIIMGLIRPTQGVMLIDGRPLEDLDIVSWQRLISHVPQNIYFADASIKENIAFGCAPYEIEMDRVKSASKIAQIHDVIENIDMQYEARMGENGIMLSGGQRQRLSIARALYQNSEIIILDEATSALDVETEKSLMSSIKNMNKRPTLIMVAHRLESLKNCDRIIRIENGKLHDETKPLKNT